MKTHSNRLINQFASLPLCRPFRLWAGVRSIFRTKLLSTGQDRIECRWKLSQNAQFEWDWHPGFTGILLLWFPTRMWLMRKRCRIMTRRTLLNTKWIYADYSGVKETFALPNSRSVGVWWIANYIRTHNRRVGEKIYFSRRVARCMLDLYLTFSWSRSLINKIREFVNGGRQHRKISSSQCNWARVSL